METTTCPDCGTEMVFAGTAFEPSTRPRPISQVNAGKFSLLHTCPNPQCSGKAENQPGSLGGDNGGG